MYHDSQFSCITSRCVSSKAATVPTAFTVGLSSLQAALFQYLLAIDDNQALLAIASLTAESVRRETLTSEIVYALAWLCAGIMDGVNASRVVRGGDGERRLGVCRA